MQHLVEGPRSRSSSDADTKGDTKAADGKTVETQTSNEKPVLTLTSPLWEIARAMGDDRYAYLIYNPILLL